MKCKPRQAEGFVTAGTVLITRRGWIRGASAMALSASAASQFGRFFQQARAADDSAQGSKLIVLGFSREAEALRGLFEVDHQSGTWRRILADAVPPARVSPDGRTLAYSRRTPNDAGEPVASIWIASTGGHDEPRELARPATSAFWSPDGRELLVSSGVPGRVVEFGHTLMRADGSHRRKLDIPSNEQVCDWSPDGQWLLTTLHASNTDAGSARRRTRVFLRRFDGSNPPQPFEGDLDLPRFAPDGQRLSFLREEKEEPTHYSLWVSQRDGTGPRKLISGTPELSPFYSCWSPDGKWLAVDMNEPEQDQDRTVTAMHRRVQLFTANGKPGPKIEMPQQIVVPMDWR